MAATLPIYQDHGKTFQADSCLPLVQAVEQGKVRLEALVRGHYPGRNLPRDALPGVKTVGFWDTDCAQGWGLDWHRNEGIELTFLESGSVGFGVDGKSFPLSAGDLAVTRPWQQHRVGEPHVGTGRLYWLILDVGVRRPDQPWRWPSWLVLTKADRDELTRILRHNEQPIWHATADLRRCFQRVGEAVESDKSGSAISRLAVRLNELFVLLLEMFRGEEIALDESLSETRRSVELFLADLCENPRHVAREWTVGEMARSCGLGVTQFIRYCKLLTNMTPARYLNHLRLQTAARLLVEHPDVNVTQIALACGFGSGQYFATAFRHQFGCAPREFRAGGTP